jgi:hypothetical protein
MEFCNCCQREWPKEAVKVYASRIGPISLSYCDECQENLAEPLSTIRLTESLLPEEIVYQNRLDIITVFIDGEYIKYREYNENF